MSRLALLLILCLGMAAPASAQDTDQRQMAARSAEAWGLPDDPEYLSAVQQYGECAVRDRGSNAMRWLPGHKMSQDSLFWMLLGSNSCEVDGRKPGAAPVFYRGVVAEYQLEHDFALPELQPKRRLARVFAAPNANDLSKLADGDRMALTLIEAGTCVAEADMTGLAVLFATAPGSQAEADAIGVLIPRLVACLPSGARLNVHPFQLRGYLAEGAYRHGVALQRAG